MDLLAAAVAENVAWCGLISAGTALPQGFRRTSAPAPALFPDVVTLRPGVDPGAVAAVLADRPTASVKDSFADLDLRPYAFVELFAARWIGLPAPPTGPTTGWERVTTAAGLTAWCAAADLPPLPAELLTAATVRVLTVTRAGRMAAGAIAHRHDGVVGISNIWADGVTADGVWADGVAAVAGQFPGLSVVGYEHGVDLAAALAVGFTDLGPLRVWRR